MTSAIKILIIDDERDLNDVYGRILEAEGYRICHAYSGDEGLEKLYSERPDLVLLDIRLPDRSGLEILSHIRTTETFMYTFVLLISGHEKSLEDRAAGLESGADDYLIKPVAKLELISRIRAMVRLKISETALRNAKADLEVKVKKQTKLLWSANRKLAKEIKERKAAQKVLMTQLEEQKRLEGRLVKSKARLQSVFDGIAEPLIMLDTSLTIVMMNRAAAAYYGTRSRYCIGRKCKDCFEEAERSCGNCDTLVKLREKKIHSYERKGFMDGRHHEIVTIYPLKSDAYQEDVSLIRITDITESKKLQQKLTQSAKLASLGFLVSGVAHEINNPNNFITFNVPILKEYIEQILPFADRHLMNKEGVKILNMSYTEFKSDIFTLLRNIENGTQRISRIVAELRRFADIEKEVCFQQVDIGKTIEKTVQLCKGKISKMVRSFTTDIQKNLPFPTSDPDLLEQILINLIINAAQAADKNESRIGIRAFLPDDPPGHLCIEVTDNGMGMDKEIKDRIFQPFFTTKDPGQNTGLGLTVCQSLLETLRGAVEVESLLGRGSKFRVLIPITL